jgi:8-oxo-dGTP pyrophosphatase MutT (NUDIX family)
VDEVSAIKRLLVHGKGIATHILVPVYRAANRVRNGSRTVGAVAIILNRRDEVLLVRNSYEPGWGLPGGFMRRRESPAECAQRELQEESGLEVAFGDSPGQALLDRTAANVTFVFVHNVSDRLEIRRPTSCLRRIEILSCEWFSLGDLPYLKRGTRDIFVTAGFHNYSSIVDIP